jgi:hypothetical protein
MWSNVAVLVQCCSSFGVTFHYTCLVGLPRDLADVCSHYRRYSGRSVTLTTHLMVSRLAMPVPVTPIPICVQFMSCAHLHRDDLNNNFLLQCEFIPSGRYIQMFRTDLLPPSSEYICPSRNTYVITVFIYLFLRDPYFSSSFWFVT